jgi:hypothetical protein
MRAHAAVSSFTSFSCVLDQLTDLGRRLPETVELAPEGLGLGLADV